MPVGIRRSLSVGLVSLCATVGWLAFATTPALAAADHVFSSSFTGETTHTLSDPTGIAVNNATGNVYVVDKGNNRVEEFSSEGVFVAEFNGSGTAGALSEPEAIAIDNSGEAASEDPSVGDVYVTNHNVIDKFTASGTYLGQITGTCPTEGETQAGGECMSSKAAVTAFGPLKGVAVDPKGQVWVYQEKEEHGYIDAYSDAQPNAFLANRKSGTAGTAEPGLAVNSEDDLYVTHEEERRVAKLNSMGERIQPYGIEGSTGIAVEPSSNDVSSNNDVYIDAGNPEGGAPEVHVLNPNGTEIEAFGEAQLADHGGTGIAVSYADISSGDVYVVDSTAGKVDIFTPPQATVYAENFSFGGEGSASGKFMEPSGIAVNEETGDIYVVDKGDKRVEEFTKEGHFLAAFAPPQGFEDPEDIAVDNTTALANPLDPSRGAVYVTDQGAGAVDKFSATGVYEGTLPFPEGVGKEGIGGVAVSPVGNVWVGTAHGYEGLLDEFSDTGTFEGSVNLGGYEGGQSLVVEEGEGGEVAYVSIRNGFSQQHVEKLALPSGSKLSEEFGEGHSSGLALDSSTGELFADDESDIERYAPVTEQKPSPLETFPSTGLSESDGIAVGPAGTVYATERIADDVKAFDEYPLPQVAVGAVAGLKPTSVTLQGSVDPEGAKVSSCEFEYGTTTSYGQTAECEPASGSLGEGTKPVLVGAKLSGLLSGTTYHYRLVASNVHGTNRSSDHEVKTLGPSVTDEQVTFVESTAATLQAQIDPEGGATSYHFEYDTRPYVEGEGPHGTSLPAPSVAVGSGTSAVLVSVKVQGLQPGATYYYRVVAEGEPLGAPESFYGLNKTFTTNLAPGSAPAQNCANEQRRGEQPFGLTLPDCRAYEMVSPVNTEGQDATDSAVSRAAISGEAITYSSRGNFADPTGGAFENQFISRRGTEGWSTQSITPLRHSQKDELVPQYGSMAFTPELTEGIVNSNYALTGEAHEEEGILGLYVANFANGSYRYVREDDYPVGASTDLSHVVVSAQSAHYPKVRSGPVSEWVDGHMTPVSVTNSGQGMEAVVGSISGYKAWRAVSADGSRVYFTAVGSPVQIYHIPIFEGLYVRVNAEQPQSPMHVVNGKEECEVPTDACTIEVSASQRRIVDPHGPQTAYYWGASTDGSRVFFTSNAELTEDAYTGPADNEANLYEYDLERPVGERLKDLTVDGTDTDGAAVLGVVQISEDGSYVYFVADGDLAGKAVAGQPNLYVSHDDGSPRFIATLAAKDETDWEEEREDVGESGALQFTGQGGLESDTATVSPSGSALAFISEQSLTGYDNEQAEPGECEQNIGGGTNGDETGKCREVYLYDAETGGLVCASCNPSGAQPIGPAEPGAGYLAGGYYREYRSRSLLEDGTLFFDSDDALVPHASDGQENVYEYEHGHVYAISDVAGGYDSFFMDASPNGDNVFFGTADQLLRQDTSNNVVVYDARVDGGFPVSVAPPSCDNADSCKPPESPQPGVFGSPSSATFSGPGNATPAVAPPPPKKTITKKTVKCKKGFVKNKKGKCVKKKSKRKAKKSARANRRTH